MVQQISLSCPQLFDNLMSNVAGLIEHAISTFESTN